MHMHNNGLKEEKNSVCKKNIQVSKLTYIFAVPDATFYNKKST